jgi:hypothetical protein
MLACTGAAGVLSAAAGLGAGFAAAADSVAVAALPLRAAHAGMGLLTRAQLRVRDQPERVCCCGQGMIPSAQLGSRGLLPLQAQQTWQPTGN